MKIEPENEDFARIVPENRREHLALGRMMLEALGLLDGPPPAKEPLPPDAVHNADPQNERKK